MEESPEYLAVQYELNAMEHMNKGHEEEPKNATTLSRWRLRRDAKESRRTYAAPFWIQYYYVLTRLFQQYWRTPSYIYSKFAMGILCSMFNGFTFFKAKNTMQGLQNQMLSIFMLFAVMTTLAQQYVPMFVSQRDLYEAREQPSRTFSWFAFIAAQITSEIPYQIIVAAISFLFGTTLLVCIIMLAMQLSNVEL